MIKKSPRTFRIGSGAARDTLESQSPNDIVAQLRDKGRQTYPTFHPRCTTCFSPVVPGETLCYAHL
jgi:hypothetical protein